MRFLTVGNLYPPQHLGGYERMWQAVVRELRARGHAVRVLTTDTRLHEGVAEEDPGVERVLEWYWRDHRFPRRTGRAVRRIAEHDRDLVAEASRHVDLVSWWAMGGLPLSVLEAPPPGTAALSVVHDDWLIYGREVDPLARREGPPPAERLGHGVFVSAFTLERARMAGWLPPTQEVVHSGYDETAFGPAEPWPWRWRLLVPGRIDARKGVRAAVAALDHLPEETTLTFAGGGDDRLARELDRHPRVDLTGPLSPRALAAAYAEADVVLFPVEWGEPWGLVPLEAMAVGRPVVATGTGGSAEYLLDGVNALLHEPADPLALAYAVERLAEDRELRERLRAAGYITAREHTMSAFAARVADAHEVYASAR